MTTISSKNASHIARRAEQRARAGISTQVEDDKLAAECKRKYKNQSKSKLIVDEHLMNARSHIKVSTFNVRTLKNLNKMYEIIA